MTMKRTASWLLAALPLLTLAACGTRLSPLNPLEVPTGPGAGAALYRVQCGPGTTPITDTGGHVWLPKQTYTPGTNTWGYVAGGIYPAYGNGGTTTVPAGGFPNDLEGISPMMASQNVGSPLRWSFEVPDGTYTVTTYYMEDFWGCPGSPGGVGSRIFNVSYAGILQSTVDVFQQVGCKSIYTLSRTVAVSGGVLNVDVVRNGGADSNATIGAIKIQ